MLADALRPLPVFRFFLSVLAYITLIALYAGVFGSGIRQGHVRDVRDVSIFLLTYIGLPANIHRGLSLTSLT
jgi:hypothetical protein